MKTSVFGRPGLPAAYQQAILAANALKWLYNQALGTLVQITSAMVTAATIR
jgi:hypothetical protein